MLGRGAERGRSLYALIRPSLWLDAIGVEKEGRMEKIADLKGQGTGICEVGIVFEII